MIVGDVSAISAQAALNSRIEQGLNFLSTARLAEQLDGRIEIAGGQVFAILSSYHTRSMTKTIEVEGHRRYLDLQYITQGEETIGWAPDSAVPTPSPYDHEQDAWSGYLPAEQLSWVHLTSGMGMLLYPYDGHAPQYTPGKPTPVRKVVVKIAI
jgi:YhcH/YjgK/YiaL family protein